MAGQPDAGDASGAAQHSQHTAQCQNEQRASNALKSGTPHCITAALMCVGNTVAVGRASALERVPANESAAITSRVRARGDQPVLWGTQHNSPEHQPVANFVRHGVAEVVVGCGAAGHAAVQDDHAVPGEVGAGGASAQVCTGKTDDRAETVRQVRWHAHTVRDASNR